MSNGATRKAQVLHGIDAHHRVIAATIAAIIIFFLETRLGLVPRLLGSWDAFALAEVVMAWIVLFMEDPYDVRKNVVWQDNSLSLLFGVVLSGAIFSLGAVGLLLGSSKDLPHSRVAAEVGFATGTVLLTWVLLHTMFALRYAHLYYANARQKAREHAVGGLIFPGEESPDYLDFAYFSFVVGMTFQVSDVNISSRAIRRLVLLHGLISFCFNTSILAIFVNIVANLI